MWWRYIFIRPFFAIGARMPKYSLQVSGQENIPRYQDPLSALASFIQPAALSRPWLVSRGPLAGINLAYDGTPLLAGLGRAVEPEPMP